MRPPFTTLTTLLVAFLGLLAPASAQDNKATAELYLREVGGLYQAAIEIEIQPTWHLYHDDLGPEDAVGKPTKVTFSGADVTWAKAVFPEPDVYPQEFGLNGTPTFINGHEDFITVYAQGEPQPGANLDDITVTVSGLTCTEEFCLPYRDADLASSGTGADSVWADFPVAAFPVASGATTQAPSAGGGGIKPKPTLGGAGFGSADAGSSKDDKARAELYVREAGGVYQAAIEIEIESGWHLYHDDLGPKDAIGKPTIVTLGGADVTWTQVLFPEPHEYPQEYGANGTPTTINGHEDFITLYAEGQPGPGATPGAVTASIAGQTCTEEYCLNFGYDLVNAGAGTDSLWRNFPAAGFVGGGGTSSSGGGGSVAADNSRDEGRKPVTRDVSTGGDDSSLMAFLGLAVFWGLFTLLMPCTYPMIPITISFFTKQAEQNPSKLLLLSMTYGLGIVAIFILIGVAFSGVIIPFATHPITNIVIGTVFIFFALSLFGWINLQPPRFLLNAAGKASMRGGLVGVFLMGTTLVVTSFTCTAPFVGSLLAAGASGGMSRIVLGMGVFGLTMAIPFVALSLVPRKLASMPKAGEWMHVLKVFMGFVELAAALKFLSNADLVWKWDFLTRELFLTFWAAIFIVAAVFLFGLIRMKNESHDGIGPGRMVAATFTALFASYCMYGLNNDMDSIMTSIIPPYSHTRGGGGGGGEAAQPDHPIVKDDYDAAVARASQEGKAVLVNFTGYT